MASSDSPLVRLGTATGRDFPNLIRARELTASGLEQREEQLGKLDHDAAASIVLMGSWGRAEVTSGSDDDFMVLVDGPEQKDVRPSIDSVKTILKQEPGSQGLFAQPVFCDNLVGNIGLDKDDNKNLTRRMLFLLESVAATHGEVYAAARARVLHRYLDESIKDLRPPRFLLNDTVRYWRTLCVDFAGKEQEGPERWGLRNAKLRTSRKILFAGGLLPLFECVNLERGDMFGFLDSRFDLPPTDRIAQSFLDHSAGDAGARALGAYDEFLALLDDEEIRRQLTAVTRETADSSDAFAEVRRLAQEIEAGLLALLFETEPLSKLVRQYAIF